MKTSFCLLLFLCCILQVQGQTEEWREGAVSYVSSQSVYVKFSTTEKIDAGDTLFVRQGVQYVPGLVVREKSSSSCVCTPLLATPVGKGALFYARIPAAPLPPVKEKERVPQDTLRPPHSGPVVLIPGEEEVAPVLKERIRGRISAASYTNFYDGTATNRLQYAFVLQGNHLKNSRFSVDNYITFRHSTGEWAAVQENIFDALKIYALSVKYDLHPQASITVGRKINPRISNMGAVDGLQYEQGVGKFVVGALGGFRPDFADYSINTQLLQLGAYVGYNPAGSQTTLAAVEQRNGGATDRRFVYLQHHATLAKKVDLFGSMDVDLYEKINNEKRNTANLTNLFVSVRYSVSKKIRLSASYDNRRNIIYYESYNTYIDQLIDDETRQGLRFGINYRPFKMVSWGVNSNWRFQKSNSNLSRNVSSYLNFAQIPWLKASATVNVNLLQTNYLDSKMFGLRLNKEIIKGKLNGEITARLIDYQYSTNENHVQQKLAGGSLSYNLSRKLSLYLYYEGSFNDTGKNLSRVNAKVIQRL
jgi:hypothetical protein